MFRNYIKTALRHFGRHRLFAVINIACLTIGITFSMVIGVYVLSQKRVNGSLRDVDNQYILKSKWKVKGMGMDITTVAPLARAMKDEYPRLVRNYYRYNPVTNVVSAGDKHFRENMAIGDTTMVSMYGFALLYGNKSAAFANYNSALISERLARKLFGTANALGKTITIGTTVKEVTQDYSVSGVLKDIPYNSVTCLAGDDSYDVFMSSVGSRYYGGGDVMASWQDVYDIGTVELQPGVTAGDLAGPVRQLLAKYTPASIRDNLTVELAPVRDYYLKDNNGAVARMIGILAMIAVFILLMAIINFININIGTSAYRLKEIGLRKVFGSVRRQLVMQFLTEAYVLTVVSAALSLLLYQVLRPMFERVLNTHLQPFWQFGVVELSLFGIGVALLGFAAGGYPAFVFSASRTVDSVKGKIDSARGGMALRKALLVVQFAMAVFVFISALIVTRQVSYIFHKDLGYDREKLLVITAFPKRWDSIGVAHMEDVKRGMLQLPAVRSATVAFEMPDRTPPQSISVLPEGGTGKSFTITQIVADEDYGKTLGIRQLSGTFFQQGGRHIPGQVVLNESAAKLMGWTPAGAVGKKLKVPGGGPELTVAGVIGDYHYASLHQAIEPLSFIHPIDGTSYRFLILKLNSPDLAQAVADVGKQWKALSPHAPFDFIFMDDKFEAFYRSELQLREAAGIATGLNLVIVFLGLFGVVALSITKRNREMALRKVLGADIAAIVGLFIRDYSGLIVVANLIAWPLAWLFADRWLENFAYRIQQGPGPYLIVFLCIFLAVSLLIAAQCWKTASETPVRNLRVE